jgi:hypothetical protein
MVLLLTVASALAVAVPLGAAQSPRAQQYNEGAKVEPAPPAAQATTPAAVPPVTEAPAEETPAEEQPAEEGQAPAGQQTEGQKGLAVESTAKGFLPFTGFHLGVAFAAGLAIAAAGLGFRRLGRQRAD